MQYNGIKIVIDGPDLSGKGTAIKALEDFLVDKKGLRILNLEKYWAQHNFHPQFNEPKLDYFVDPHSFDVLISAEPTYVGIGKTIRSEITYDNERHYSALFTAQMFAADRFIANRRYINPALELGKLVILSRSETTSIIYQPVQAEKQGEELSVNDIVNLPGNEFSINKSTPNLIILTLADLNTFNKRRDGRADKQDNSMFEKIKYVRKFIELYQSNILDKIYRPLGTKIIRLDTSISINDTREKVVKAFLDYIESNNPHFLVKD